MNGAQAVWAGLRRQGVEIVFGYPGGKVIPLYDTLPQSGVRHVLARHEQGAALMAGGYARASGRVGVALATSGPGACNLLTGLADAHADSVPLVCLTGQVPTRQIGTDAFQECDILGLSLPCVKHSYLVRQVDDLPATLDAAFWIARTGRRGPVLVDLPHDVLCAELNRPATAATAMNAPSPEANGALR